MCKRRQKTKKIKAYQLVPGNEFFIDGELFCTEDIVEYLPKVVIRIEEGLHISFDKDKEVLIKDVH